MTAQQLNKEGKTMSANIDALSFVQKEIYNLLLFKNILQEAKELQEFLYDALSKYNRNCSKIR